MIKLKKGDRLVMIKDDWLNGFIREGMEGKFIGFGSHESSICVEFDKFVHGHDGNLLKDQGGVDGYCWFVNESAIQKITKTPKTKNTKKSKKTQKLKKVIKVKNNK